MRNFLRLCLAGVALFCGAQPAFAQPTEALDSAEVRECRRNLHLIFEAIQAYRRVHHDLPDHLGELLPRFLSDERYLTCPTGRRFGLTSQDVVRWKGASRTSYAYEFGPEPIPRDTSGGSTRAMREWKRVQMGLVGSEVPMVRCLTHERGVLNLAFGGRIYERANIDWEPGFESEVEINDFTPARCLALYTVTKKIIVPIREPSALPNLIDLSNYYTAGLDEIALPPGALRSPAALPSGVEQFNGTSFDVRGLVQLRALRFGLVPYPTVVSNILIGLPGRGVRLLLGTRHAVATDGPVADCVFHLAGGRERRFAIRYGRHLLSCVPAPDEQTTRVSDAQLAWRGDFGDGRGARLYQCEWLNPLGEQLISSMDFLTQPGESGPFLVALTVESAR